MLDNPNNKHCLDKHCLFVQRKPPYTDTGSRDGLDALLVGSAFGLNVSLLFMDDGVFQLNRGQNPGNILSKRMAETFRALEMYDVDKVYADKTSLEIRGLSIDDLVIQPKLLDKRQVSALMEAQAAIFTF